MIAIDRCPSLLIEGHTTYSSKALNYLFDGKASAISLVFHRHNQRILPPSLLLRMQDDCHYQARNR